MPIKFDATGKRWVEMEFVVPGEPDAVWRAIATGPGYAAWFIKADIEEKVGGALTFHFGPGVTTNGVVTQWEPPHCFGYVEIGWGENAPPLATEITVTARKGGTCLVRMVHSLFSSTEDWDDQMESFESGWPGFIEVLRLYLAHHAGAPAASFQAMAAGDGEGLALWRRLMDRLGLSGADVGERRTVDAAETLEGTVVHIRQADKQRYVMMHVEGDAPGVVLFGIWSDGDTTRLSICRFFYGDDAGEMATAAEARWGEWLEAVAKGTKQ